MVARSPPTAAHPLVAEAWAAAQHVYAAPVMETPLEAAPWLAEMASSCCVHLKMEARQATGSFKARGAAHGLRQVDVVLSAGAHRHV